MPGRLLNLILVIWAHRSDCGRAGESTTGVMSRRTKSITINITNVAAQAYLTMRLEASAVFWSGDGVGRDPRLGFIVANRNDTPGITLTISIALFLSVWMQLRQPMSHFAPGLSVLPVKKPTEGPLSARWGIYASIINEVRRMGEEHSLAVSASLWISSGWAADPLGTININLRG